MLLIFFTYRIQLIYITVSEFVVVQSVQEKVSGFIARLCRLGLIQPIEPPKNVKKPQTSAAAAPVVSSSSDEGFEDYVEELTVKRVLDMVRS